MPVPVSPVRRTVVSVGATTAARCRTSRSNVLRLMIPSDPSSPSISFCRYTFSARSLRPCFSESARSFDPLIAIVA
ncbi:hypothetical protein D3C83_157090 [compost metagenome]